MMHSYRSLDQMVNEPRQITGEQPRGIFGLVAVVLLVAIVALTIWFLLANSPNQEAQAPPADVEVTFELQP